MEADGINSIEELRKLQEAAQAQGQSITNYQQWANILEDFEEVGIQSTGSYSGDLKLHEEIISEIQDFVQEAQAEQKQREIQPHNEEASKIDEKTHNDSEQTIKANVVNATSSMIMADYMKYYHLLH